MLPTGLPLTKICRLCKRELSLNNYYKHKNTVDRLKHECKNCWNKLSLQYYFNNKETLTSKRKVYYFKNNYDLSLEEIQKMKESQNYRCKICDLKEDLVVDHNHGNRKVRSLLCNKCNQGLGSFKDNPDILRKAANYLEVYSDYVQR